jgi:tetratricopeptide (TPR) repeat protein
MSDNNVRLQNLRDFTVQIRRLSDDTIVGTGIVVSMDGKVVTCAHVVEEALGAHPREANGDEVGVYFPQARMDEEKSRRATVAAWFSQHDDDVVLLQLVGGPAPIGPEQIAILGTADLSEGNPFRSYGYCPLGPFPSARAEGIIMGDVEAPVGCNVQADPVQLKSSEIAPGMSGAAVLDDERNLVVGLISETWFPGSSTKHRDTSWAIDARVLAINPLSLSLRDAPFPKRPAPQPKTDVEMAQAAVAPGLGIAWNNAPPPLEEWVGRVDLLKSLNEDWTHPERLVTGLIGFGGEGKSSLARRWVGDLLVDPWQPQPDGVFWWGFYTKPNVDEFFEAALKYLSGGRVDSRQHPSSSAKAHLIAAMLYTGRYLFVLDGLEVLQHQKGDQYGLVKSADLREFLSYFAASGHQSFCLITSRAPVLDLMEYTTYSHQDVTRLSSADGRALLRVVGVKGPDAALDKAVAEWDGHALTLGLLGAYLAEDHGGNISCLDEIPTPTAEEPRYERVYRVLRRYDEYLSKAERAFLMLFSAFRTPVEETAFDRVFRVAMGPGALNVSIAALDDLAFDSMIKRLESYRILRYEPHLRRYMTHPLISAHYLALLTMSGRIQTQDAHDHIKDYYLNFAGDIPYNPTLEDLAPLIEMVHHACRAGAYDEADNVRWQRIHQSGRFVLTRELGAYEAALSSALEFFPGGDKSQEPQVTDPRRKHLILNEVGYCLMSLGQLSEAIPLFKRSFAAALKMEDWTGASRSYQNLAQLYTYNGPVVAIEDTARIALTLARRAQDPMTRAWDEMYSLVYQAWAAHLGGDLESASMMFQEAEPLVQKVTSQFRFLYGRRGIRHTDHLLRIGEVSYARDVAEANLAICERYRWTADLSRSHRALGDLDADTGQHKSAHEHYDKALKIARDISRRDALIEALLARGRWAARHLRDPALAFGDLNEALGYAGDGGYRLYEAEIRIELAGAHLAAGDPLAARAEAEYAHRKSVEMGYYWGQVDAEEVLAALDQG